MTNEYETKKCICEVGKRVYQSGFVAANDGNFSVRLSENEFICTPTGVSKGFMTPDMLCKVDKNGNLISGGKYKPSSEMKMHMRVYKLRPDVKAVVHTHAPYATSFAIAGIPLNQPIMSEAVVTLGCVPIADYATPSTEEVPNSVEKYLQHFDAVLLANHGALTWGHDLMDAYYKMETLEFYAKLTAISTQLGGPRPLSREQVLKLYELRRNMNLPGRHPAEICIGKEMCGGGCHGNCEGNCKKEEKPAAEKTGQDNKGNNDDDELRRIVAEVTRRVLTS